MRNSAPDRRRWAAMSMMPFLAAACAAAAAQAPDPAADAVEEAAASRATVPGPASARALDGLAFLAGCWAEGAEGLHEQFTAPTANLILGTSRFMRGGRVAEFEFHTIVASEEGSVLTPHPGGRASVPFASDSVAPGYVAWANASHDFPQRIIYDGGEDGLLVVTIEGPRDGRTVRRSWRMRWVACPGA